MQSLYLPIKYAHLIFVTTTIVLFNLRFWLRTMQPEKPLPVILRVLPHINDSLLLFTGHADDADCAVAALWRKQMAGRETAAGAGLYFCRRILPARHAPQRQMVRALWRGDADCADDYLFGALEAVVKRLQRRQPENGNGIGQNRG